MGFFDSFKSGAKDVFKGYDKVKLKEKITYDELYEIMKDETYSVGKPEITGSGLMRCIQFPAVDKYKIQIAITSKTITISKIYSGAGGLAKEINWTDWFHRWRRGTTVGRFYVKNGWWFGCRCRCWRRIIDLEI